MGGEVKHSYTIGHHTIIELKKMVNGKSHMCDLPFTNNDRYQWDRLKLSPKEYYQYLQTESYPLLVYETNIKNSTEAVPQPHLQAYRLGFQEGGALDVYEKAVRSALHLAN